MFPVTPVAARSLTGCYLRTPAQRNLFAPRISRINLPAESTSMSLQQVIPTIARELSLGTSQVAGALALFDEGNTLPFIARYRKEATGGLDEIQLRDVRDRAQYLRELGERR